LFILAEVERFGHHSREEARGILSLDPAAIFLPVSKLYARTCMDEALKVYQKYSENMERSMFLIIGDGLGEDNLKRLAAEMGLGSVRFLGRLSDEEITPYYEL
jgi:glycosyltransferase involved in cell wall biosynthesis